MDYTYEILKAEPRHKMLQVKYSAEGQDDYYRNFQANDWSEQAVTDLITGFAATVVDHWNYQATAPEESPVAAGSVVSATATPPAAPKFSPEDSVRMRRDFMLRETDQFALTDRTMSQEMTDYRQALRDVPQQSGFPDNIVWPTQPE